MPHDTISDPRFLYKCRLTMRLGSKANGIAGSYIVDSGANISALSQSEAGRLGLNISHTASRASDISGISIGAQVTEISDLWVGKTHLKHVAFLVYPDSSEPFSYLPDAHKGVLGIPVLIALAARGASLGSFSGFCWSIHRDRS